MPKISSWTRGCVVTQVCARTQDRLSKKAQYVRKLEQIFKAIDNTSDGMVTEEKLSTVLENPRVVAYFQTLDVEAWLSDGPASCCQCCCCTLPCWRGEAELVD